MTNKRQSNQSTCPKVALFIDMANVCELDMDWILRAVHRQGQIEIARAYGSFTNWRYLSPAAERLFLRGVRLVHCPAWRNARREWKDCADEIMLDDIYCTLDDKPDIDRFVICTGNGHFVPTAIRLRIHRRTVIVIAPPNGLSRMLQEVANQCLFAPYSGIRLPLSDDTPPSDNRSRNSDATRRPNAQGQETGRKGDHRRYSQRGNLPPLRKPGTPSTERISAAPQ
jgi:hypothetical protein